MFITIKLRDLLKIVLIAIILFSVFQVLFVFINSEAEETAVLLNTNAHKVLIIDPGHGGLDGGAVAEDGTVESAVNLDIALKMRDIAVFLGSDVVMTRESEELSYPDEDASIASKKISDQKERVKLINSRPNAELISIHQNTYPSNKVHGAQVFYKNTEESKVLAEKIQFLLNSKLITKGRRVAAPIPDSIYLMKNANCTAVLIECGFLSNPQECEKLKDNDYKTKLAMIITTAWLEDRNEN